MTCNQDGAHLQPEEAGKVVAVARADAVADPGAEVVEHGHAAPRHRAVLGSQRPHDLRAAHKAEFFSAASTELRLLIINRSSQCCKCGRGTARVIASILFTLKMSI